MIFDEHYKIDIRKYVAFQKQSFGEVGCPFEIWKGRCDQKNSPCAAIFPHLGGKDCPCLAYAQRGWSKDRVIERFWKAME